MLHDPEQVALHRKPARYDTACFFFVGISMAFAIAKCLRGANGTSQPHEAHLSPEKSLKHELQSSTNTENN